MSHRSAPSAGERLRRFARAALAPFEILVAQHYAAPWAACRQRCRG